MHSFCREVAKWFLSIGFRCFWRKMNIRSNLFFPQEWNKDHSMYHKPMFYTFPMFCFPLNRISPWSGFYISTLHPEKHLSCFCISWDFNHYHKKKNVCISQMIILYLCMNNVYGIVLVIFSLFPCVVPIIIDGSNILAHFY